jgi:hypothetical protein
MTLTQRPQPAPSNSTHEIHPKKRNYNSNQSKINKKNFHPMASMQ